MIEADEGYFSVKASTIEQNTKKAGRESVTTSNVVVMAESTVIEDIETRQTDRQCRYFKAKVLEDHQAEGTDKVLKEAIDLEKLLFSRLRVHFIKI